MTQGLGRKSRRVESEILVSNLRVFPFFSHVNSFFFFPLSEARCGIGCSGFEISGEFNSACVCLVRGTRRTTFRAANFYRDERRVCAGIKASMSRTTRFIYLFIYLFFSSFNALFPRLLVNYCDAVINRVFSSYVTYSICLTTLMQLDMLFRLISSLFLFFFKRFSRAL